MSDITISTGYEPRPLQAELHASMRRFNVLVCHRRFGKTVLSINEMVDRSLRNSLPNPRYAYLAPFYRQAKQVAWDYLKHYTRNIPGIAVNEADLRVDFMGRRLQLLGADNYDALRGIYLDGAVLDEYAQMAPKAWTEVIRPALADRLGWATFIGTPKGLNEFHKLYDEAANGFIQADGSRKMDADWFAKIYRASETGVVPQAELDAARRAMSDAEYEQEFECSFTAAIAGAYYAREMDYCEKDKRITSVPRESGQLVHTAWDLGIGDPTAIWFFQRVGLEIRIIDYMESSGVGLEWYAARVREKPYAYGKHILPHDAANDQLATGKSLERTLNELGISNTTSLPPHKVETGINEVRKLLAKCWFDREKTQRGVECLRQYRAEWSEKNRTWAARPFHDWASHGADAFRYLAMGIDQVESTFTSQFNKKIEYKRLGLA
jgi:phage terminase large subunit